MTSTILFIVALLMLLSHEATESRDIQNRATRYGLSDTRTPEDNRNAVRYQRELSAVMHVFG